MCPENDEGIQPHSVRRDKAIDNVRQMTIITHWRLLAYGSCLILPDSV